jgi:predicted sulfurtransferase
MQMYCTGGIRCDIYSTFLKSRGYNNLYTLEGGIQVRREGLVWSCVGSQPAFLLYTEVVLEE